MADTTTIQITVETWQRLSGRKRPGDDFNDVVARLLDETSEPDRTTKEQTADALEPAATGSTPEAPETVDTPEFEIDVPGSGPKADARRDTVLTLYEYLQHEGSATKRDFLQLVDAETVQYSSVESFWSNCIKGKDTLGALPGVVVGDDAWYYRPPD